MSGRRTLASILLGVAILAGCGGQASTGAAAAADPTNPCAGLAAQDDNVFDPIAQCDQVLALANARLGWLHWPVSSIRYRRDLCPPNARCAFAMGAQGWVIYTFWSGDPVMVHVGPRILGDVVTGELAADQPEPLPDWLLEELERPAS
jgi:hypothetical protein